MSKEPVSRVSWQRQASRLPQPVCARRVVAARAPAAPGGGQGRGKGATGGHSAPGARKWRRWAALACTEKEWAAARRARPFCGTPSSGLVQGALVWIHWTASSGVRVPLETPVARIAKSQSRIFAISGRCKSWSRGQRR